MPKDVAPPNTKESVTDVPKYGGRSFLSGWNPPDYNPDDLVWSKGKGLQVYQDMLRDPHVKTGLLKKKARALAPGWQIPPTDDSDQAREIAAFIEWVLHQIDTGFDRDLFQMLDGLDCGFSLQEKLFEVIDHGPWVGKIRLARLKSKDPNMFVLRTDKYRNLIGVQEGDLYATGITHDPQKFCLFQWLPRYESPYGTSDLRAAYRAFWLMDVLWKLRAKFLEKFGSPTTVGKHPDGLSDNQKQEFMDAMKGLLDHGILRLPEGYDMTFLEAVTDGGAYDKAQQRLGEEILIAILGAHLAVAEGKLQGSKAQGQVHQGTEALLTELVIKSIEWTVKSQIIKQLVYYNYGNAPCPDFKIKEDLNETYEDVQKKQLEWSIDRGLMQAGVTMSVPQLRERYKRPAPPEGEELATPPVEGIEPSPNLLVDSSGSVEFAEAVNKTLLRNLKDLSTAEVIARREYEPAVKKYSKSLKDELGKKKRSEQ